MKKITSLLILVFALSTSIFAQTKSYCDSITSQITATVSGTKVTLGVKSSGSIISREWVFGDSSANSKDASPTHDYMRAGTYTPCVYLILKNLRDPNTPCTTKVCKTITITTTDPCANFAPKADITVGTDGVATFEAESNSAYTYKWDFGDGTYSTDRAGKHTYKPGTYKPCVTITYTSGTTKCTKTLCKEITVTQKDPCHGFNPTFQYQIGQNGHVTFNGIGDSTNTLSYTWSYGDGTSGTGIHTTHTYKPGTYKPCVTIYNSKTGCKKTICIEITITGTNTDPCKDFHPDFGYRIDGNVVIFEAKSGTNNTYKWTFSNGQSSTDRIVKIDFKKPGTYKACVTITTTINGVKCSKTVCKEIVIKAKETKDPCKAFNPKVSFSTDGLKIHLEVDGGKGAIMEWNFGDGSKGSTHRTVTHTYSKSGKYTICVTVYDAKRKCKKIICFTISVEGKTQDPCVNFNPSFSYKISGNTVTVEGTNLSGVEFSWSWGDKLGDKGRVSSHTYKVGGKYVICMTAYDPNTKCTKTICKTLEIGVNQKMIDQGGTNGKDALSVYPNPADTKVTVVTMSTSDAKISIKDAYGVEVIRYDATPNENKSIDVLVDTLPKGIYYVLVEQDGKVESTKFVK